MAGADHMTVEQGTESVKARMGQVSNILSDLTEKNDQYLCYANKFVKPAKTHCEKDIFCNESLEILF